MSPAARLFRLALEKGSTGAHYHAVDEEEVATCSIADAIGAWLAMPVKSIGPSATGHFGTFGAKSRNRLAKPVLRNSRE